MDTQSLIMLIISALTTIYLFYAAASGEVLNVKLI
jgi:hypothetical protein